jgi:integrase
MHETTGQAGRRRRVERGVYLQPNGKYAVCFMVAGKPRFRTVGTDLGAARAARAALIEAASRGEVPVMPDLRFDAVAHRWMARYEALVAADLRRERIRGASLLPRPAPHAAAARAEGLGDHRRGRERFDRCDAGGGLFGEDDRQCPGHPAQCAAFRAAPRLDRVDPIARLERGERPRPAPRGQRVLGRDEVARLLVGCAERYRPLVATALFTGMRISELLGLVWGDVDLDAGVIHVRFQLSRVQRGSPPTRVSPKTRAAVRDIPLVPPLRDMLRVHRAGADLVGPDAWVFPSRAGTPLGHRNAQWRALTTAARRSGREDGHWPPLRFHDLRHTFASHLIVALRLDVAQVSRILGHAQITTTLSVYTHLFDDARHAKELKDRMAASAFARLLDTPPDRQEGGRVRALPARRTPASSSARERAALRWGA